LKRTKTSSQPLGLVDSHKRRCHYHHDRLVLAIAQVCKALGSTKDVCLDSIPLLKMREPRLPMRLKSSPKVETLIKNAFCWLQAVNLPKCFNRLNSHFASVIRTVHVAKLSLTEQFVKTTTSKDERNYKLSRSKVSTAYF